MIGPMVLVRTLHVYKELVAMMLSLAFLALLSQCFKMSGSTGQPFLVDDPMVPVLFAALFATSFHMFSFTINIAAIFSKMIKQAVINTGSTSSTFTFTLLHAFVRPQKEQKENEI